MVKVRHNVRLHPDTVTNHHKHTKKRKKPKKKEQVNVVKVHEKVWETAMRLANGDRSRIVVRSAVEVVVVNQSKRKQQ